MQNKSTESDQVMVVFNGNLRDAYRGLYDELKAVPGMDGETLDVLKLLGDGTPVELPTAFAMVNDIAWHATEHSLKSKNSAALMRLLDAQEAFSTADKDTIHVSRRVIRPMR